MDKVRDVIGCDDFDFVAKGVQCRYEITSELNWRAKDVANFLTEEMTWSLSKDFLHRPSEKPDSHVGP